MYIIKFMPDYGEPHTCLWSVNEEANKQYGLIILPKHLPISEELQKTIVELAQEYQSSLNWTDPLDYSPWTNAHKEEFLEKATNAYNQLINELGSDFEVISVLDEMVNGLECAY